MERYSDRTEAGRALGRLLAQRGHADPVVLALPRGGVPVALEVARALAAPLDLVMVRKLGVPVQPELAAGAVVNGDHPQIVVNADVMRQARLGREDLDRIAASELEEIRRRRLTYLKDRAQVPVAGRTAIIVDDGIATGATVRAAIRGTRQRGPARLVVAVPVAAPDTIDSIAADGDVDDVVCPLTPDFFYAIGAHYDDFRQLGDDEVVRLIAEADRLAAPDPAPPGNG